ncbi:MAG: flagellar assembly protein FliW [Planctomycetia bacterium]|nr:flagellar assembly protein FliW [Planctomycetia bacterium]
MMTLTTRRFGTLQVADADIYSFPLGLPGLAGATRFVLLPDPGGAPFQWLQSADRPELALVACDPMLFAPDYRVEVKPEDLAPIGLADVAKGFVLAILTVPSDPKLTTANLLGPLVFNPDTMQARQLVLPKPVAFARVPVFGAPTPC